MNFQMLKKKMIIKKKMIMNKNKILLLYIWICMLIYNRAKYPALKKKVKKEKEEK